MELHTDDVIVVVEQRVRPVLHGRQRRGRCFAKQVHFGVVSRQRRDAGVLEQDNITTLKKEDLVFALRRTANVLPDLNRLKPSSTDSTNIFLVSQSVRFE